MSKKERWSVCALETCFGVMSKDVGWAGLSCEFGIRPRDVQFSFEDVQGKQGYEYKFYKKMNHRIGSDMLLLGEFMDETKIQKQTAAKNICMKHESVPTNPPRINSSQHKCHNLHRILHERNIIISQISKSSLPIRSASEHSRVFQVRNCSFERCPLWKCGGANVDLNNVFLNVEITSEKWNLRSAFGMKSLFWMLYSFILALYDGPDVLTNIRVMVIADYHRWSWIMRVIYRCVLTLVLCSSCISSSNVSSPKQRVRWWTSFAWWWGS